MGHKSGDPDDQRCNRNWGHKSAHGDFWSEEFRSESYGHPAYVKRNCKVPRWGPPIPFMDEHGNQIADEAPEPELVDAFVPLRPERVTLVFGEESRDLNDNELRHVINQFDPTMGNPFLDLDKSREKAHKRNQQLHENKMGTSGEVGAASDLPQWSRGDEKIRTGMIQLDWALGGGIAPGVKIKSWGKRHTWKSTLAAVIGAANQQYRDKMIRENFDVLADRWGFEATPDALEAVIGQQRILGLVGEDYDPTWPSRHGLDTERTDLVYTEYLEQSLQDIVENMQEDLDRIETNFDPELASWMRAINYPFMWVDSWDSFKLWADQHGAGDKKNVLHDDARMGSRASLLSKFFRTISSASRIPITLHAIGQNRIKMGGGMAYGHGDKGNAEAHNTRVEMKHRTKNPDNNGEQEIILEFRQTQHPGGMNVGEREEIRLTGHIEKGLFKEANLMEAADSVDVLNIASNGYKTFENGDVKVSERGISNLEFAEKLKEEGVYEDIYEETFDKYDGG